MDILGVHIGDNKHEVFNRLSFNHSVETGKNCFCVYENMFGNFRFHVSYYYVGESIEKILLSYIRSDKGAKGRTASIEEVAGRVHVFFESNLGLPISEDKADGSGNAVWSDIDTTVRYFYKKRSGVGLYLESPKENDCVVIEISDFASRIKDDEFKRMFLQVRKNERLQITNREQPRVCLKTKFASQYIKYILLAVLVLACMFIYAFSHRYQVVANGRAIIDKWAGTIEEVEYKK